MSRKVSGRNDRDETRKSQLQYVSYLEIDMAPGFGLGDIQVRAGDDWEAKRCRIK